MRLFAFLLCFLSTSGSFAFTDEDFKVLVERLASVESHIDILTEKDIHNTARLRAQENETARLRKIIEHQEDVIAELQRADKVKTSADGLVTVKHHEAAIADLQRANNVKTAEDSVSSIPTAQRNATVHRSSRSVAEGPVAFTATKRRTQSHIGIMQTIVFDTVVLNLGGGYHSDHGLFIAPVPGVYMFSASLLTSHTRAEIELHADLVHNGNVVNRIYGHGDSGRHDQGSQTAVLQLQASDEVWVRNIDYNDGVVYGSLWSSFCGSLLYPN